MASGKITKRSVDALISIGAEGFLWDDGLKGFGAKITRSGAVSYILQFRLGGREARTRRYTIGSHGSPWTPTTARDEAERLSLLIAQGIDPVEVEKQRRREAVDLAFNNYADRFEKACVGKGWRILVARSFRIHVKPVLGVKPLPKITRADVVAVFDRMPGTQVANRRNVFAVLRRLFRWAISRGDIDRSPMEGMETPPPVKARDRWLSDEELGRVWKQAYKTHRCFGPIVRLLIVTGQRREEVHRPAVLRSCMTAFRTSDGTPGNTFQDAVVREREKNRLIGRPLPKRAVGSTLLLKGLEADVAVVLNADELDARNLYVAMTRGSAKLVICSKSSSLNPTV